MVQEPPGSADDHRVPDNTTDDAADGATDDISGVTAGNGGASAPAHTGFTTALPPRVEAWRRRSVTGAILTGFALGLKEALEPRREEPSIVMETSGDPPRDLPVEAEVDQIRPSDNVVTIRPWLLPDDDPPRH